MKHTIIITIALLLGVTINAAGQSSEKEYPKIKIGVHTGMDIGAAAPYPPSSLGGGSKISAVPYLTPALGFSGTMDFDRHWSVTTEVTYKKFGIDARAWVTDQRFKDKDDPDRVVSFRGTAKIGMKFTMLEVPVYASYAFGKRGNHRVLAGLYYAQIFKSEFNASPQKGLLTNIKNPDDFTPVSPSEPFTQNFDNDMSKWDLGFLVGYQTKLIERVDLGLRLSVGFKDIFRSDAKSLSYKMIHMRGTVVLGFRLFDY